MKVAAKSRKRRAAVARATLSLSLETYRKIDQLRGNAARSVWLQALIDREVQARERGKLVQTLREQYTPQVCHETLVLNDEFPVQE